jgi:HPt (histidine-containing phosphotransfer) domain-containing protein
MKILVIDSDSERIKALKSLEFNGHLVQVIDTLSKVKEFLDQSVCQMLVLGPDQLSGDSLKTFSEWRQSLGEDSSPFVVALGPRQDVAAGIDHFFPIPFDTVDMIELLRLRGIPPEPEVLDYDAALKICDGDEDLFHEIVGIFIMDSPKRIKMLMWGMEQKDWHTVGEVAHLMKGSALNLSAESFSFANQNLERAGIIGSTSLIPFWFDQVVYEYNRLISHLKELVGGSKDIS